MGAHASVTDTNILSGLESNATGVTAFSMPGWQLALWATAYLALVLVAVTGNATVIWIILAHERMRTVTNYFIVNLAVADLLLSAAVLPFSATMEVLGFWAFGRTFCDVWAAVDVLCCTASILSLCTISPGLKIIFL